MIKNITKPTLIVDKTKCLNNIRRMADKAKASNVKYRPHFKTHQSAVVGEWFREFGAKSIAVSSVSMAKYFFQNGWDDITIAFPVNILEIADINELAASAEINLLIISLETLEFLEENLQHKVGIYLKINTGYNRTGILAEETDELDQYFNALGNSKMMELKGILTHAGQTYDTKSKQEIINIYDETKQKLFKIKERYASDDRNLEISVGDTPSCSIISDFDGVDEIRPGNFVYYDVMQFMIGSCRMEDIAAAVACPVVGKDRSRNEVFLYCGSIHLSSEYLVSDDESRCYGLIVLFDENGWSEPMQKTYVARLSQEHGVIRTTTEYIDSFRPGDIIGILPVHSCLTASMLKDDVLVV